MLTKEKIRNVAIIAHVDHGKTTLVDELLKQSGTFRKNQVIGERIMDSGDIERERGITILSKNTSVFYKDYKINIVDTPGHADFGGEVERVLKMVDGVILVVDAFEGPMPQTKFVLKNALELELPVVVCINKTDRPEARPKEVTDEVLELFLELDASESQLDSKFLFASAKKGVAIAEFGEDEKDMAPLFDAILNHIPCPGGDADKDLQILISTIDYSEYVGRIGIGEIQNGSIKVNDEVVVCNIHRPEKFRKVKISNLYTFEGLARVPVNEAGAGEIVAISGLAGASGSDQDNDIHIGDTIASVNNPVPLPFARISEPTISMTISVNDSPFAGEDGKYLTSRHLRARLTKETQTDVSLRVEDTELTDSFKVSGRGELHLSILIETMRREGYEFQVSRPEPIFKEIDGRTHEPMEIVTIDVPEQYVGIVIEKLGGRKGELTALNPSDGGYTRLTLSIPARGLIGYRGDFMTDTRGTGILNTAFDGYLPFKGAIPFRVQGSLIAFESGEASPYGLYSASDRGLLLIGSGTKVYAGMVVGICARSNDMEVNVCKRKQLTNMRASGSDDSLKLPPPVVFSLEQALEFITDDELVEITPKNMRIRKKILSSQLRHKAIKKQG